MPLPSLLTRAIYTATVLAWLGVIFDAIPYGPTMSGNMHSLAILVAAVGSVKFFVCRMGGPAHELYQAGKRAGRVEALTEDADGIVRLDARRALLRPVPPVADRQA